MGASNGVKELEGNGGSAEFSSDVQASCDWFGVLDFRSLLFPNDHDISRLLGGPPQQNIRQARPKAQVAQYVAAPADRIASAGGDMARAALASGLIDRIGDRRAFQQRMVDLVGADQKNVPGSYKNTKLDAWIAANPLGDDSGDIGVLTVAGDIVDGEAGLGTAGAETIADSLERGLKRGKLKALVVRVDSPGGSTLASQRLIRLVERDRALWPYAAYRAGLAAAVLAKLRR
jgi:protease-4